jgi:hypothetical protein
MDRLARKGIRMSESFDIVLSKLLGPDELAVALACLITPGLRVDVRRDIGDLPEAPGAIWAVVGTTEDQAWPCVLNVLACSEECGLGPYPDLRIAVKLWDQFGTNSLCGTYPFAGDLDPYDPYWSLACISGQWFLASTAGTRLMGPYTDGIREFPGDEIVRLVRPVAIPDTTHGSRGRELL